MLSDTGQMHPIRQNQLMSSLSSVKEICYQLTVVNFCHHDHVESILILWIDRPQVIGLTKKLMEVQVEKTGYPL